MSNNFNECLKIGKEWETRLVPWLEKYLGKKWEVVDTSDVHRDQDGDQFPDFTLVNQTTEKVSFLDAKKRCIYKHKGHKPSFGFDKNFYTSYTNIAKKYNTKCYVGFYDPAFDAKHWYLLDLDKPEDFIFDYGNNGFGQPICYRWYVGSLQKFKL